MPRKVVTDEIIQPGSSIFFPIQDTPLIGETDFIAKQSLASVRNLEAMETLSNTTEFSGASGETGKTQFTYGSEFFRPHADKGKFKDDLLKRETEVSLKSEKSSISTKTLSKSDHVYEEVNAIKEPSLLEYDILDYYEKYSPTTAKTLINTLFLPRHKICKQCARLQSSPVYTDCLIYAKRPLHAREVQLLHQNNALSFKYYPEDCKPYAPLFLQYENNQPCMLVYSYSKTNASSIFYSHGPPRDVFDLKTLLEPHILLLSSSPGEVTNTQLYHRSVNDAYRRVSKNGNAPMTFRVDHENVLSTIKHVGYDTDLQNWMNYRNDIYHSRGHKQDDTADHRANRSSLLLLEPLLLMPDLTRPRYRHGKNRIAHSEHMKIVKIVTAYTLSFLILASITFYIVYFT